MHHPALKAWVCLVGHAESGFPVFEDRGGRHLSPTPYHVDTLGFAKKVADNLDINLVLISDHLIEVKNAYVEPKTGQKGWVTTSLFQVITTLTNRLEETDYRMAGLTANRHLDSFPPDRPVQQHGFVWGGLLVIKPGSPGLDEVLVSDAALGLDYSLKHLTEYGGLIKANDYIPQYDSPPLTDKEKSLLKRKWPRYIEDSKQTPGGLYASWTTPTLPAS